MKNNKVITILLVILLVAIWGTIGYRVITGVSSVGSEEGGADVGMYGNSGSVRYEYKDDVKDPFQLLPVVKKENTAAKKETKSIEPLWVPPPYKLSGIIIDKKKKVAVLESVDGMTFFLSEGDSLNGLKIAKIEGKKVLFIYGGKLQQWNVE